MNDIYFIFQQMKAYAVLRSGCRSDVCSSDLKKKYALLRLNELEACLDHLHSGLLAQPSSRTQLAEGHAQHFREMLSFGDGL